MSEFVVTFSKAPVTAPAPISTSSGTLWDTETRQLNITADEPLLLEQERRMQQAMQYVRILYAYKARKVVIPCYRRKPQNTLGESEK